MSSEAIHEQLRLDWDRTNDQGIDRELNIVLEGARRPPSTGMLNDCEALRPKEEPCGAPSPKRPRCEAQVTEPELFDDASEHGPKGWLGEEDTAPRGK